MESKDIVEAVAYGVGVGGAFYVLGAVGAAVVPGVSAAILSAVGFASAFAASLAKK